MTDMAPDELRALAAGLQERAQQLREESHPDDVSVGDDVLDADADHLETAAAALTQAASDREELAEQEARENEMASQMGDRWDGDEAQVALLMRFVEHYGALDRAIDAAREADDYEGTPIPFVWSDDEMTLVRAPQLDSAASDGERLERVRAEAIAWAKSPNGEAAPTREVGRLLLALLRDEQQGESQHAQGNEHWCGWCRTHPDHMAPADENALSYSFVGSDSGRTLVYVDHGHIHMHEVKISDYSCPDIRIHEQEGGE